MLDRHSHRDISVDITNTQQQRPDRHDKDRQTDRQTGN